MGVSTIEDRKSTCCLSPRIYQPSSEDMDAASTFPRKKKMFSSSSFYEEPNAIYPTVQEQVQLCRKIAASLSDDCNLRSKGADMFFRRVRRAEKWIVAQGQGSGGEGEGEAGGDPARLPYVRPSSCGGEAGGGPPRLKLILDPRTLVDMGRLLREGVDIVQHDAVSPEVCHGIVRGLNSPTDRGGRLFARRKIKSEEWVVDEEKVRHLLEARYGAGGAWDEPSPVEVAQSVMRAAEAKVMTYPNAVPHVPVIESLDAAPPRRQDPARAPRGWSSASTDVTLEPPSLPPSAAPAPLVAGTPLRRCVSFNNFNASPRAWNATVPTQFRPAAIRSVKPPSVLVQ